MNTQDYKKIREQLSRLSPQEAADFILKFIDEEVGSLDAEFLAGFVDEPPPRDDFIAKYALRNCGAAQVILGMSLITNVDEPERASEGIFWLARASAGGNGQADHLLGSLYAAGQFFEQNISKAKIHLEKAAKLNLPKSQYVLGVLYLDEEYDFYDPMVGKDWLQKSADQGNEKAIALLNDI